MLKSSVLEDSYASNLFEQKAVVKNSAASFRQGSCWSSSCDDKQTLKAILFVLTTGCRWADLPREYGSYATAWRRLRRWTRDGTLVRIWDVLLAKLEFKGKLDLKKCHWMLVCSRKKGGQLVGRTCGGSTSKRHAVVEGNGWPLAVVLSDGRCHDITRAVATVESSQMGWLRRRPRGLVADKRYDWAFRRYLSMRGIWHSIPERKKPKRKWGRPPAFHRDLSSNCGQVERFFAWLDNFRRLATRFERLCMIHLGFIQLAYVRNLLRNVLKCSL